MFIANEAIDSRSKSTDNEVICKMDIVKAYDHVNWDFLISVLIKIGLGDRWVWQINGV